MKATNTLAGKFIVLDGPDGAGKSEQHRLLAKTLEQAGIDVESCRDPGGTEIGDRIRKVLLDYDLSTMNVSCEALLFMASRAQLIAERIRPALDAGKTVLCDRFVTSTCAYQGAAGYRVGHERQELDFNIHSDLFDAVFDRGSLAALPVATTSIWSQSPVDRRRTLDR